MWPAGTARDDPHQTDYDPPHSGPSAAEGLRPSDHSRLSCTPTPAAGTKSPAPISSTSLHHLAPHGEVHLSRAGQIGADQIQVVHSDAPVILLGLEKV